ncbi:dUTP diphosphatase [Bacillus alveayuensis]|uniref:dUTP diphosphatase n=1 Tax=Aeribacillus alveayuensis TaxID=279215 RepID=UPI0005D10B51|nr:dUTP diphosphatase [Bacillus alveayuensis]
MNFKKLFHMQKELDQRIETQHKLHQERLMERKILALLVEIGELANETRCFKFWSVKPPSKEEVILEEYVDGLHFLLSIGLELNMTDLPTFHVLDASDRLTEQFLTIFDEASSFKDSLSVESYLRLFKYYLQLGKSLGFSMEQIYHAYVSKNEVNHIRQSQGY